MLKHLRIVCSLLLVGVAASSAGCAVDMADATDDELAVDNGETTLGTVAEELGEAGCGTMACTAANSCSALDIQKCTGPSFVTSSLPYGSASCPQQFVVRDTTPPTTGGRILPMWRWKGATLTAANCASARVEDALYAKTSPVAQPQLVGTEVYKGVWNGSGCTLTSTTSKPFVNATTQLLEVRATASAKLGATPQRVDVGFWHICG